MASFKDRINVLFEDGKNIDYKMSQQEFADRFGVSRGRLQGWMDGRGEPDSEMMKKIAEISRVSVDWLVGATDLRKPYVIKEDSPKYQKTLEELTGIKNFKIGDILTTAEKIDIENGRVTIETVKKIMAAKDQQKKEIAGN